MAFITDADRERISAAIREAESRTSGELVTVIAREADDYYYIPTLWAALAALLLPALVILFGLEQTLLDSYGAQVSLFLIATLLFRIPALKYRLIPREVKRQRAARLAHEQFLLQNLHHTEQRTGVMLFVSVAEHYVEVLADKGINEAVQPGAWDWVVAEFVARVKEGRVGDGFVNAVEACGEHLVHHFPAGEDNRNELPNHLIEL
ncbi:MAG: TPM domain-containing protein [Pseudomonadota bacterium]